MNKLKVLYTILFILSSSILSESIRAIPKQFKCINECPHGWIHRKELGECWLYKDKMASFDEAEVFCISHDSTLYPITNENQLASLKAEGNDNIWVWIVRMHTKGTMFKDSANRIVTQCRTSHNCHPLIENYPHMHWAAGEPSTDTNKDCVSYADGHFKVTYCWKPMANILCMRNRCGFEIDRAVNTSLDQNQTAADTDLPNVVDEVTDGPESYILSKKFLKGAYKIGGALLATNGKGRVPKGKVIVVRDMDLFL